MQVDNEYYTDGPATVIFRKWKPAHGGGILALFPYMEEPPGHCNSYEHVGQHGLANYLLCIANTVPAKPAEYADLKEELDRIYECGLVVRKRRNFTVRERSNQ